MKLMLILFFLPLSVLAQDSNRFGFPLNERTGRVTFDSIMKYDGLDKATLFRRANQFIAEQDFDRSQNIRCADKNNIVVKFYDRSVRYADSIEGKIIGSGFLPFTYKDYKYIFTVFDYKIQVKDGACKYEFENFRVLEFKKAPRTKSRGMAYGGNGIVGANGSTSMSASLVEQQTMEEFMERLRKYYKKDGKTDSFSGDIDNMVTSLQNAITDTF